MLHDSDSDALQPSMANYTVVCNVQDQAFAHVSVEHEVGIVLLVMDNTVGGCICDVQCNQLENNQVFKLVVSILHPSSDFQCCNMQSGLCYSNKSMVLGSSDAALEKLRFQ